MRAGHREAVGILASARKAASATVHLWYAVIVAAERLRARRWMIQSSRTVGMVTLGADARVVAVLAMFGLSEVRFGQACGRAVSAGHFESSRLAHL
jgi:hypothetical protein